ncbi:MAG TPA: ATP-binding protein, partial [Verrucomicrobiae bacterium]|nr:ATP-binding protein [Verrucomicrobiae bacterium]
HLVQAERDRIARDIHDDLGSEVTKLLLTCEVAQINPDAAPPLSQMCAGSRNILATIDEVIWTVNSQNDNLEDFSIYVCKYAQNFLESTAIRFRFDVAAELPDRTLSQLVRRDLFLAIKEALNNAAKHSKATELTVRIELIGFRLNVVVADNGRGFDPARTRHDGKGLANMKQRMAEIGGDCEIVSRAGEGCQVSFQVPLKQRSFFRTHFPASPRNDLAAGTPLDDKFDPVSSNKTG